MSTRPTLRELALEADAWRELYEAHVFRSVARDIRRADERILRARDAVHALGLHSFTPPAIERISEPERLGDILQREGLLATQVLDEGFVWEDDDDEPSAIANVIGHTLGRAGR